MRHAVPKLATAVLVALCSVAGASAQTLAPNQTEGFALGKVLTFTYQQNYACLHQPGDDLDYDGRRAQSDSGEFQTPICQVATEPAIDPAGKTIRHVARLFVLVPMFSVDNDQNPDDAMGCPAGAHRGTLCGRALGQALISLFGAVPEAYKRKPLVSTQCPDPGSAPGTCTMHASSVDLGKALVALGKLPPPADNIFLPTPNHSHVIDGDRSFTNPAVWWEVRPVLVSDRMDWPSADGRSGITSVRALYAAEKRGAATEVPSNFFLFFSSGEMAAMQH